MSRTIFIAGACAAVMLLATSASAQRFRRPVACESCIANWYYYDHAYDPSAGSATNDWNCGSSTYDDHRGSDFSLAGGNAAIDNGYDITAAAAGEVIVAHDGEADHCTACGGAGCGTSSGYGYGNYVTINHGDRKTTYAHMRRGSVRVAVGDRVACGQVIGQIGSAGCSTGAHLHVELRTLGGTSATAYDPFHGSCSSAASVWVSQGSYRGMPAPMCEDGTTPPPPPPTCPSGTYAIWTCNSARTSRTRCIDGMVMTESCPSGCVSMPVGTDDVCASSSPTCPSGTYAIWTCNSARTSRTRCIGGVVTTEECPAGCVSMPVGTDDVCAASAPACPSGVGSSWACTSDGSARQRCASGMVERESCPNGCAAGACNAPPPPPPACPSGIGSSWACTSDGAARQRCLAGVVEMETCASGCAGGMCTAPPSCPSGTSASWTCTSDGTARRRCTSGSVETESCARGCVAGGCVTSSDADGDGFEAPIDCNDMDNHVYPGAPDGCGDAIDHDCDGHTCPAGGGDAGVGMSGADAGVGPPRRPSSAGGCSAAPAGSPTSAWLLLALAGLAVLGRRRPR